MQFKEMLPWNWGKKEIPVNPAASRAVEIDQPLPPVTSLQRSVNRLFDDFFDDFAGLRGMSGLNWEAPGQLGEGDFLPALDASETDDAYTISLELPGLDEKDLDISLSDDAVTIRGHKSQESERDESGAHWIERRYGSFKRVVPLPVAVEADAASATFRRGVLDITLPKADSAREVARVIPIES